MYMVWVTKRESRPAPRLTSRFLPRKMYTNPTNKTMNEAPSREPAIMAKDSFGFSTPASRKASEVAAMGEPDNTILAVSQPKPSALAGLSTETLSRIIGANGFAPSLTSTSARMNKVMLLINRIIRRLMLRILAR